jgi:hypothetical protein
MAAVPREKFLFRCKFFVGRSIFLWDKLVAIPNKLFSIFSPRQGTKVSRHKIVDVFTHLENLKCYIFSRISHYASSIGSLVSWIFSPISSAITRAADLFVESSTISTFSSKVTCSPQPSVSSVSPNPDKSTNIGSHGAATSSATVECAEAELDDNATHHPAVAGSLAPAAAAFISLSRRHPCYFALGSIHSVGNMSTLLAATTTELQMRGGS